MPFDRSIIGKTYSSNAPFLVEKHKSIFYALATGDDNPAYFIPGTNQAVIAPPMYVTAYGRDDVVDAIKHDPEVGLDLSSFVFYSQKYRWLFPVQPKDQIRNHATITHVKTRENGGILGFKIVSQNQMGADVARAYWEFFDKSAGKVGAGRPPRAAPPTQKILWQRVVQVPLGQSYAYAEASGDHNPIHVDDTFAKGVGFPGVILHGMCTMAYAHRIAVETLCGPDRNPLRLRELQAQFSRPVIPGQTLTFRGYKIAENPEGRQFGIIVQDETKKNVLRNVQCLIA